MSEKYRHFDDFTSHELLSNPQLCDKGQGTPYSDVEDMSRGLCFIPGEVTIARRRGEQVSFEQLCSNPCCWYWQFPSGARSYYYERYGYEQVAQANGKVKNEKGNYPDGIGACPICGNIHMRGGYVPLDKMNEW